MKIENIYIEENNGNNISVNINEVF